MKRFSTFLVAFSMAAPLIAADRSGAAPQLPQIDAGTVLNQINAQHQFPQPAPATLDTCVFTDFKNNKCYFKCQSGAILTEPGVRPDFSSGEPAGPCAAYIIRPIAAPALKSPSILDKAAAAEIARIASTDNSPFGSIDGGNLGLSAYRLTPEAANLTVAFVKKNLPGIHIGNRHYSAQGPQMILVITSDDEPIVHMYDQDRTSGKLTRIDDFNSSSGELEFSELLTELSGKSVSTSIPLGAGSAEPYWWDDSRKAGAHAVPLPGR